MVITNRCVNGARALIAAFAVVVVASSAQAEIDGHGPDAWQVTGVSANDVLNARMGPGTSYRVIETFAHNERGMQQITCVPFYTAAHYTAMSDAQIRALPPRWCLMRNRSMSKAGWVAQRFITPDQGGAAAGRDARPPVATSRAKPVPEPRPAPSGDAMIDEAQGMVRDLYDAQARAERGGADPLRGNAAGKYFTSDIVALLRSGGVGAHPLYGAQDFDGRVTRIASDPDNPMLRGMITINVDFTNFGERQRAVFYLRADTTKPEAPLRIFRVEHDGWSYP